MSSPDENSQEQSIGFTQSLSGKLSSSSKELFSLYSGKGARKGYIAGVDQGVISATNFLATIILARNITPTELGVYAVGFIVLRLTLVIQDGIIVQPLNTFGAPMGLSRFRHYVTSTGIIQMVLALFMSAIAALSGWILTKTGNDTAGPAMFSLWAPILFWQIEEYIRRTLYVRGEIVKATLTTLTASFVRLTLLLIWAYKKELSGVAGLEAIAFGTIGALLPGIWITRGYWSKNFYNLWKTWKHNWRFGRWMTGGNIANWISAEFYPVLTAGLISFAAAGAYRALQNLVAPIHLLLRATDTYLTPRAARGFKEQGIGALNHTLRLTYLVTGIPVLVLLVLATLFPKPLLNLFYGETYLEYSPGILLMALFYGLLYIKWPLQIVLKAGRYSQPIFYANIAAMIAMFTFGIWAIINWSVYGTIAGQAVNALIATVILWISWQRFQRGKMQGESK